jgi:hypothetical protein
MLNKVYDYISHSKILKSQANLLIKITKLYLGIFSKMVLKLKRKKKF